MEGIVPAICYGDGPAGQYYQQVLSTCMVSRIHQDKLHAWFPGYSVCARSASCLKVIRDVWDWM